jgi:hypothetical protein
LFNNKRITELENKVNKIDNDINNISIQLNDMYNSIMVLYTIVDFIISDANIDLFELAEFLEKKFENSEV